MEMAAAKVIRGASSSTGVTFTSHNFGKGDDYRRLKPTISISFVNKVLFAAPGFHHEFALRSGLQPSFVLCPDLSIHIIELPKFLGKIEDLKDDHLPGDCGGAEGAFVKALIHDRRLLIGEGLLSVSVLDFFGKSCKHLNSFGLCSNSR